jgi:hypothetical protein
MTAGLSATLRRSIVQIWHDIRLTCRRVATAQVTGLPLAGADRKRDPANSVVPRNNDGLQRVWDRTRGQEKK